MNRSGCEFFNVLNFRKNTLIEKETNALAEIFRANYSNAKSVSKLLFSTPATLQSCDSILPELSMSL